MISVAVLYGYPGLSVYCATKHAMEGFSKVPLSLDTNEKLTMITPPPPPLTTTDQVLRLELTKFGVDVVTIQPGDFSKATHLLDRCKNNKNEKTNKQTNKQKT